jgi:hypothetical protein
MAATAMSAVATADTAVGYGHGRREVVHQNLERLLVLEAVVHRRILQSGSRGTRHERDASSTVSAGRRVAWLTAKVPDTDDVTLTSTRKGSTGAMVPLNSGVRSVGERGMMMLSEDTSVRDQVRPHAACGPLGHRPASHSSVGLLRTTSALTTLTFRRSS